MIRSRYLHGTPFIRHMDGSSTSIRSTVWVEVRDGVFYEHLGGGVNREIAGVIRVRKVQSGDARTPGRYELDYEV